MAKWLWGFIQSWNQGLSFQVHNLGCGPSHLVVKGFGPVAVVIVKEKRKKIRYLVSTNFLLPALEIVKFYAHRWKIEQMIKDLKQRLGLGDHQVCNLQAIQRLCSFELLRFDSSQNPAVS